MVIKSGRRLIMISLVMILMAALLLSGCSTSTQSTSPASTASQPATSQAPASQAATDVIKIKFATPFMEQEPPAVYALHILDLVEKKLGSRVKIERFTGGTMGNVSELLTLVKTGAVDVITLHIDQYPQDMPLHRVLNMEQNVDRATTLTNINKIRNDIPETKTILDEELNKNNIIALQCMQMGPTGILTKGKSTSLDDVKGKKINVITAYQRSIFEELGYIPVNVAIPDLYESMLRGVIDNIWMATAASIPLKWYEVSKTNLVVGEMMVGSQPLAFNKDFWNKLPTDVQQAFIDASNETVEFSNTADKASIDATYAKFKESGVDVVTVPTEQSDLFYKTLVKYSVAEYLKGSETAGVKDKAETILKYWEPLIGLKQ